MKKGVLFLLCLGGGVLFGGLFFVAFGAEMGYDWTLGGICAGGGFAFAIIFFITWRIVQKHSKPITFDNPVALIKLQENESEFETYEARFHGRIPVGKGLKAAVCETYIYLLAEKLRISYFYFRKIYTIEVNYHELYAEIEEEGFFLFQWMEGGLAGGLIDEDVQSLRDRLKEKGVTVQEGEPFSEMD